jgi:hypothetical protein
MGLTIAGPDADTAARSFDRQAARPGRSTASTMRASTDGSSTPRAAGSISAGERFPLHMPRWPLSTITSSPDGQVMSPSAKIAPMTGETTRSPPGPLYGP